MQLTKQERDEAIRDTRRFDLRRFLGGLFVIYGVLVTGMGIARPEADKAPTGGIPINLYTGIAMFIIGAAPSRRTTSCTAPRSRRRSRCRVRTCRPTPRPDRPGNRAP